MDDYDLYEWCKKYSVDYTFTKKECISDILKGIILKSIILVHKTNNKKTDIRTIFMYMNNSNMGMIKANITYYFDQYIEEEHLSYKLASEMFKMSYESLYMNIYESPWFQLNPC